jgi:TubC N-terminal docking domain
MSRTEQTADITDVLRVIQKKGIELWAEGGELHYRGPKGALSSRELDRLRASKRQLIAHLQTYTESSPSQTSTVTSSGIARVPLSFSQRAHFNLYQLHVRRAIRQIASATRLRGPLNVDALRRCLGELVRRHDALRTRVIVVNGEPLRPADR